MYQLQSCVGLLCLLAISWVGADYTFVLEEGKTACLLLQGDISVTVKDEANYTSKVPNDNTTTVTGSCGTESSTLTLGWTTNLTLEHNLSFDFVKSKDEYHMLHVIYNVSEVIQSFSVEINATNHNPKVTSGSAYKCDKGFKLTNGNSTISMTNVMYEAFLNRTSTAFSSTVEDCEPTTNKVDTIVPIAVGAALAGMVIIVLIGYCIGRRRTRAGYQQMNA